MVQFGAIIFCRTYVELLWSVQVVLKKLTKSHDYSRLFSKEKRRLKTKSFLYLEITTNSSFKSAQFIVNPLSFILQPDDFVELESLTI